MSAARPWSEGDLGHLRNVECTTTYDTLVCDRAADHIRDLEARLARVRELPGKLRKPSAHTYASENADVYAAYDRGRKSAADELEAALQSDAGPGSNQPELDNPKSEG